MELAANHANIEFLRETAHKGIHANAGGTNVPISGQPLLDRTLGGKLPDLATKGAKQWPSRVMGFAGASLGSVADSLDALDPWEMTAKHQGYQNSGTC